MTRRLVAVNERGLPDGVCDPTAVDVAAWERAQPAGSSLDLQRQAFVVDLELAVERLRAVHAKLLEQVPEPGTSRYRDGKWEGAVLMARATLEELEPMLAAWKRGEQHSRDAERLMGRDDRDGDYR